MTPPIFSAVNVPAVQAFLQNGALEALRFYSFGRAPQEPTYPYAVWRLVPGAPLNNLSAPPDMDALTTQVDVYARQTPDGGGAASVRAIASVIRDAIEPVAHIVAWHGESIDPDTGNNVFSFDASWFVQR